MKVLIVCRYRQGTSPFITEQVDAMAARGIEFGYFYIRGKGIRSYISSYKKYKKQIAIHKPEIIHAHYGLSGFFANWQRKVPVVTTYHGGDINYKRSRPISKMASWLSQYNIYVSKKLANKAGAKKKFKVQPCGINLGIFQPIEKQLAREKMNLDLSKTYVLFASAFSNPIKNATLAKEAIKKTGIDIQLLELKGYPREEVMLMLNACDVALLTSFSEGSPQFIKEAMACNCPIVSANVGSVEEIIDGTAGCYLADPNSDDVCEKLKQAIDFGKRTNGHLGVTHLDNSLVADKIISIYHTILS